MTALGKLLRTTAFKLSLAYLAIFAFFAIFVLGYVAFSARGILDEQVGETISEEAQALISQFNSGGIVRLVRLVERRSSQPGSSLYLVTSPTGDTLAGNISGIESEGLLQAGRYQLFYRVVEDGAPRPHRALVETVVLPGGFRMIVGRDLDESDRLIKVIRRAVGWSLLLVLGLAVTGGVFVARRVLKRVDAMTKSARSIMEGDFTERLAIAGTGDELDRVANSLNVMLDRIAELMAGLREVSDNIAHDLKTPLTRLRNSAEEALRSAKSEDDYRAALDDVIEEADDLIKIFNALLMIARAEAGAMRDNTVPLDAGDIARDVAELYEPFAEEAGVTLKVQVDGALPVRGTRELISQAMANLIDNAIKYSSSDELSSGDRRVLIEGRREGNLVRLIVADHGPGIPEADRNRAIERFVRLESSRTRPGSGLGLSLVAAVARLHSGSLVLEDNAPGLRVVFTLPLELNSA